MKKRKLKKNVVRVFAIIILVIIVGFCYTIKYNDDAKEKAEAEKIAKEKAQKEEYDLCLISPFVETDLSKELKLEQDTLTAYVKNKYNVSIKYEDITTGYSYTYNPATIYYGASLIKMVEALYLYEKASIKEIDLDASITYLSQDMLTPSLGMKKYKVGDKVSLKEIVSYALLYSDNTAHKIMQRIIGTTELKQYFKDLEVTFNLGDGYGEWSAEGANKVLKRLYEFIKNNKELGKELKGWLINTDEANMINNKIAAHKYGHYAEYFHDIAVVYEDKPYAISIFTRHGATNYQAVIKDVSEKILELHNNFHDNRTTSCQRQVYGNE